MTKRGTRQLELWSSAMAGDRRALDTLYLEVKGVWQKFVVSFQDVTALYTVDDWGARAGQAFAENWRGYEPERGVSFSTWMYRVVYTTFCTEHRRQRSGPETPNVKSLAVEDCLEYLLVEGFAANQNEAFYQFYEAHFLDVVKRTRDPLVFRIARLKLFWPEIEVGFVCQMLRITGVQFRWALRELHAVTHQYGLMQKGSLYVEFQRTG